MIKFSRLSNLSKSNLISLIISFITLIVVLVGLIPVIFPAFLTRAFSTIDDHLGIDPLELGLWAYPLLITNIIIFGMVILYYKKRLPFQLTNSIKFIFNFEISPNLAFLVVTILIGIYIIFSVGELTNGYYQADYYERVQERIENFQITEITDGGLGKHFETFLTKMSVDIFKNDKVIPFLGSISLLLVIYFTVVELTGKRFAGIVSLIIILQSGVFLMYDTSVAYTNFWTLFYVLSLYLILKKWALSPIVYVISILSKGLTLAFFPMTVLFIYRTNQSRKTKIKTMLAYGVLVSIILIVTIMSSVNLDATDKTPFDLSDFWVGFSAMAVSLRLDGLVLIFLLPLTLGLFIASKNGIKQADSVMFLITAMIISAPLLQAFSVHQNVPYRFIPLIVFFAIGVGLLLSKKTKLSE